MYRCTLYSIRCDIILYNKDDSRPCQIQFCREACRACVNHSMSIMIVDAVGREGSILDNDTVSFSLGAYPLSLLVEELRMILNEDSPEVTIPPTSVMQNLIPSPLQHRDLCTQCYYY
jgi:hypothetical protein